MRRYLLTCTVYLLGQEEEEEQEKNTSVYQNVRMRVNSCSHALFTYQGDDEEEEQDKKDKKKKRKADDEVGIGIKPYTTKNTFACDHSWCGGVMCLAVPASLFSVRRGVI